MQDFHQLEAWRKSHEVVLRIYAETRAATREEVFGVIGLLRHTSVAIAARIVEGCGRGSNAAFSADLQRSVAACNELEYYLLLASDLQLLTAESCKELTEQVIEVRKMLYGLVRKL
jgi:four helix bundle protein